MPSSIASFITPTASTSPAKACAGPEESKPGKVDQPPLPMPENQRAGRTASPGRFEIGTVSDLKSESRARSDRNRRANKSESAETASCNYEPEMRRRGRPRNGAKKRLNASSARKR